MQLPRNQWFIIAFFGLLILTGCTEQQRKNLTAKPNAIGTPGQTLLVIEDSLWYSEVGDSIRYKLAAAYPILPAPEPMLDLSPITAEKLVSIKKQWKNIIFVGDLTDKSLTSDLIVQTIGEENTSKNQTDNNLNYATQRDRWAEGQLVIYLFGYGKENLMKAIEDRSGQIIEEIYKSDKKMVLASVYSMGSNNEVKAEFRNKLNINLNIPADYRIAHNDEQSYWLRKQTTNADLHILIRKMPYTSEADLSRENILKIRNAMGKAYISTHIPNSYMSTDTKSLTPPIYYSTKQVNGNYTLEARGLWRMENDFMGGPFISYLVYDAKSEQLLFLDGFVYAPEKSKRKYMQRLEAIFNSLQFI